MRPSELSGQSLTGLRSCLDFDSSKEAVAKRFLELGIPGNKTEQYRHFSVKPLLADDYTLAAPEQPKPPLKENILEIRDGVVTAVPEDVNVSFQTGFEPDITHFDALYHLSHLLSPHCIVLSIENDIDLTIVHRLERQNTLIPCRIVIRTAPECRATVYESFENAGSGGSLLLYGLDVHVGEAGALTWIRNQSAGENDSAVIGSHRYDVGSRAEMTLQTFDFGSGIALHLYKNDLSDHTVAMLSHLLFASGRAHRGNVVNLRHNGISAKSVHLAKSILKENAAGIFDGRIRVGHGARYAAARQNSKAILLNDNAFMEAKPQLEIYTDELEASHGATTGQLDEAALFYLRSRGISADEARKMLILAFANEMIEEVEDEKAAEAIRSAFESAYYQKETA